MKKRCDVIGNNILIRKMVPVYQGTIVFPQNFTPKFLYGIVIGRGKDVDNSIMNESFVLLPWSCKRVILGKDYSDNEDLFITDWRDVIAVKNKIWRPVGNKVIIQRDNKNVENENILVHELTNERLQSLTGVVTTLGTSNGNIIDCNIVPGDFVRIEKWDMQIIEVGGFGFGNYSLIVPTKLIPCKIEHDTTSFIPSAQL